MHGKVRADKIASVLRERIAGGVYAVSSFLPSERSLAVELGAARNTVRSALEMLEHDGWVMKKARRGVFVCERESGQVNGLILVVLRGSLSGEFSPIGPEPMALLGGLFCAGSRAGIRLQLVAMPDQNAEWLLREVDRTRAVGVLFLADMQIDPMAALRERGVPYVVVNQEHDVPGPSTRMDFWGIGRSAAEHLLALGHRRLAVLGGPQERDMYEKLLAGFRGRAAEAEVFLDAECVRHVPSDAEAARVAALEMLGREGRPTGIFCTRDVRAYGACLAARELGLNVPDELSVVSYDDVTWPGGRDGFLTTFQESADELAGGAVRMLISWIKTGEEPEDTVIRPNLLVRRSTGRFFTKDEEE